MLTKKDIQNLIVEFRKIFATKDDLKELKKDVGNEIQESTERIIREFGTHIGNHEGRIKRLEKEVFPQV